jgi:hypothetical protein
MTETCAYSICNPPSRQILSFVDNPDSEPNLQRRDAMIFQSGPYCHTKTLSSRCRRGHLMLAALVGNVRLATFPEETIAYFTCRVLLAMLAKESIDHFVQDRRDERWRCSRKNDCSLRSQYNSFRSAYSLHSRKKSSLTGVRSSRNSLREEMIARYARCYARNNPPISVPLPNQPSNIPSFIPPPALSPIDRLSTTSTCDILYFIS